MTPSVELPGGHRIPQLGFGVFQVPPDEAQAAVEAALELGYRHVDTAAAYNNEAGVGAAIRASGIARDQIFVTTKLRNGEQGAGTRAAFDVSRRELGVDYIDLYLIHWPSPARDLYLQSWHVLEELAAAGEARSIGVSNFLEPHLERLIAESSIVPAVDQLELHPTFQQRSVTGFARAHGIAIEAYSPLGQGGDLGDPVITAIAERLGATPAQVILRWQLDLGHIVIPKSVRRERMAENLAATEVVLTKEDVAAISALESGERIGGDPHSFEITQIR